MTMDAIVIAGGVPQPGEYLYEFTQGQPKALLPIAGKPMIQWVLDALGAAHEVGQVVIMGLPADSRLSFPRPLSYFPSQGAMLSNILTGVKNVLKINPSAQHALVVSSDIPMISAEMVDWVVRSALQTEHDLYYHVITRSVMEARFPGSKRSFTRLKDVEVCGGDLNVIRTLTATGRDEFWNKVIASRKNALAQASLLGLDVLLGVLFRQITLENAVKKISQRVGLRGRAVLCPYAEVGMDVDKPHQYEMARLDLENRSPSA
jgi:molybdopterin-guanine dinucleotide biosynthesis protein A